MKVLTRWQKFDNCISPAWDLRHFYSGTSRTSCIYSEILKCSFSCYKHVTLWSYCLYLHGPCSRKINTLSLGQLHWRVLEIDIICWKCDKRRYMDLVILWEWPHSPSMSLWSYLLKWPIFGNSQLLSLACCKPILIASTLCSSYYLSKHWLRLLILEYIFFLA